MIGTKLAHYEITNHLGTGGMGEVYQATDAKLGRSVAIKLVPEAFSHDNERVARFEREARVLASLNHPNIAAIYGVEECGGWKFLVMELVGGETLAERIKLGAIPADVSLSASPTISLAATQQGVILGTAAYMSPEQARGLPVDKRADIWACGCVLYEMLVGLPAFPGDDVSEVLAGVIRGEPRWKALPADLHPRLVELLERCLEKNAKDRWRDIGDVRLEIKRVSMHPDGLLVHPVESLQSQKRERSLVRWIAVTFVATAILGSMAAWNFWPRSASFPTTRFAVSMPEDLRPDGITLSPDGRRLVFAANGKLYMRAMNDWETRLIPGAEGAEQPFFSPDGRWVAFFTNNQLKKIAFDGSAAIPVADLKIGLGGLVGTWATADRIIFGLAGSFGLFQVNANGGTLEPLVSLEEYSDVDYPELLPGGEWLLYSAQRNTPVTIHFEIVAQSLITGERRVVLQGGKFARYAPTGHLIYEQLGSLFAVGFDLKKLAVTGSPTPLGEHVATDISFFSPALFALARDGTLAFVTGRDPSKRHLVWVDRSGRAERIESLPQRAYAAPRLSPDGSKMLSLIEDVGDLWIYDTRGSSIRLTRDGLSIRAAWSPDGSRVAYSSGRSGTAGQTLLVQASDGSNEARQVKDDEQSSPEVAQLTDRSLTGPVERGRQVFSPDGKWIAYVSNESGRDEIYITAYPAPGGKFPVSTNGGTQPIWARNGELFYRNGLRMMVVETSTVTDLRIGQPKILFEGQYEFGPNGPRANTNYDVTADGQRFLMVVSDEPAFRPQIDVVLNWFEELKQRVPVR